MRDGLRLPAHADDDAVRGLLRLHLDDRLARPGQVRAVEPLGDDAVEPERPRARRASRARRPGRRVGRRECEALARPARARRAAPRAAAASTGFALPEEHVEGDEPRRDLRGELVDAALGRVQPHLHRVEVERAVAVDHDLAVERGAGRQQVAERAQLREVAQERPSVPGPEASSPPAFSSTPRKPSHFGSYCQPSPSGSSRTSSASIGGNGTIGIELGRDAPAAPAHGVNATTLSPPCAA